MESEWLLKDHKPGPFQNAKHKLIYMSHRIKWPPSKTLLMAQLHVPIGSASDLFLDVPTLDL